MGWNDPDNKDPWGNKQQPPDLEEILKRLQTNLKRFFKNNDFNKKPSTPKKNANGAGQANVMVWFFGIAILLLWVISGIFIVDPAEQALILRFGRYMETVGPGPHWIPRFIETKIVRNVDRVADYSYAANMLTKDENLVSVAVAVQYRIGDLKAYAFNLADPQESLQQATSSALRQVVGTTTLDQLITEGREAWGAKLQESLIKILDLYKTGIVVLNVSPQPARAPENVQTAFDDAIKAQEDEKRFKEQARAYEARVVPIAEGNAKRILAEAKAYATQVVLNAKGEVAEFLALLPEYKRSPAILSQRLYLDTMQKILTRSSPVVADNRAGNMLYLPLPQIMTANNATEKSSLPGLTTGTDPKTTNLNTSSFEGHPSTRRTERRERRDV